MEGVASMKMSTKGRYGLRFMIDLAQHSGRGQVVAEEIARRQNISSQYLHVLATGLRTAGLIRAERGPKGGYELTRHPAKISALDVVAALEGRCVPVECVADPKSCPRAGACSARDVWCEVASAMDGVLAGFTLQQLAQRQKMIDQVEEPAMYHI